MAIVRPKVRIVQQFSEQSSTPASPDLDVLIIGPAYNVQDYNATNKANIAVSAYGDPNADCVDTTGAPVGLPIGGDDAITIAAPPNNTTGALLEASSVKIYLEDILLRVAVEPESNAITLVDSSTTVSATGSTWVTDGVLPGDRLIFTDNGPATPITIERTVASVTSETELEMTSNFTVNGTDIDGNAYTGFDDTGTDVALRIERDGTDGTLLASTYVTVTGQQVVVNGGVLIGGVTLHSASAYMQYRSLRQDLALVTDIDSASDLTSTLGTADERNPLAVGAFVALQNTSTKVRVFGITKDNLNGVSDRLTGYTEARDIIDSRKDVYCIVPLANESSIITLFKNHVVDLADPDKAKFRVVIGSGELITEKTISNSSTGDTEQVAADTAFDIFVDYDHTDMLIAAPTATGFLDYDGSGSSIRAGDVITIVGGTPSEAGTYTVRQVINDDILRIEETFSAATTDNAITSYTIDRGGPDLVNETTTPTITTRKLLRQILDNTATFLTSGVIAGDYIEVPDDGVDLTGATSTYIIESVPSENRIIIVGTEGELPSNAADGEEATAAVYQVIRSLDKDGQVTELSAVTSAHTESRLWMVWPGSVLVSGVENASTGLQSAQPGYYLAAAVGGMVAGNPAHQNFTGLAIGGIDQVNYSSNYFSDEQIDSLSAAGWYVVLQDAPTAAPYSVHAVTTDPTTLESSETMIVKNFDYVSLFYKGALEPFLKGYNLTEDTLNLIQDAFDGGTAELKSQVRPKLGAPVISAQLTSIDVLSGSADHGQLVAEVELPRMLNLLTLILTA